MTDFNQITATHYILDQSEKYMWDAVMLGPCQNDEFMAQLKKIIIEIEEAHRLLGKKVKE